MASQKNRIALISPANNAYSETFIQVQKTGVKGDVFFYYGGELPLHLEGRGSLLNRKNNSYYKLKYLLKRSKYKPLEQAFIRSLLDNAINVVIAQYGTTAHKIAPICKHLEIPLITHFHGYDASIKAIISKCDFYKSVFSISTKVIAVSRIMQRMLVDLGCPEHKIVYNPCAPKDLFCDVVPKFSKAQFLAVGRFTDKKAPYYTILAFSKVVKKFPESKLIFAGEGVLQNTCKNLVKFLKLDANVVFKGVITAEDYTKLLEASFALVQHSITADNGDMEGTPVTILEASAAGLPVISTHHAGIPDVIEHGKTGYLVDEHDVDKMAHYMLHVLENPKLAMVMGQNGAKNISENFSVKKHLETLDEVIEMAVQKSVT